MARTWQWLSENAVALFASIAALLAGILLYRSHQSKLRSLKDAVAVERAKRQIAALNAKREVIAERVGEVDAEVKTLDARIVESRRLVVEAHTEVRGMSDEQVVDEFKRLGF